MDEKSEGGRKNGGGNDTDDTKEEETIRAVDNRDTENGVDQNVDDGIKTEDPEVLPRRETTSEQPYETLPPGNDNAPPTEESEFQENARRVETKAEVKGPIGEALGKTDQTKASNSEEQSDPDSSQAKPGKENTSEEPSKKVQSESDSAQPTVESQLPENASDVETKAGEEVKEPYDEAQNATEDKNIAKGKADQTNASNSEEQSDPDSSQADSGTDQVETSRTVQDRDGGPPQTAADSPSELAGNKGIKEPNDKTIDAPTAQNITRDKMDGSTSNGTQEASPGSGGIPDSNLEKLTKSLMVDEYSSRSLGRTLGFIPTEVYQYCGYGKPKDSTRILRMLRAWKDRTPDAKQISGLLEALKKANLKHLASDLRSQEGAEEQREAVQTSDGDSVTSPSKSVQPTTTRSDPLTDNPKSSPSDDTANNERNDNQLTSLKHHSENNQDDISFGGLSAPPEILARGQRARQAYAEAAKDGTLKVFRTRLMLVGQERVGKTSLKKTLTGQGFHGNEAITDGVETTNACEICIEAAKAGEKMWSIYKEGHWNEDTKEGEYNKALADEIAKRLSMTPPPDQESLESQSDTTLSGDLNLAEADDKNEIAQKLTVTPLTQQQDQDSLEPHSDSILGRGLNPVKADEPVYDNVEKILKEKVRSKEIGTDSTDSTGGELVSLSIWDFAGHDIYYTTHQVFLTWRAIYVTVFDLSRSLDSVVPPESRDENYKMVKGNAKSELTCLEFINFWLCSIYAHAVAPSSIIEKNTSKNAQISPPIFIVGTHRESVKGDAKEKKEKIGSAFEKISESIKKKPFECHVVPKYYAIENSLEDKDEELVALRRHIEKVAMEEPYMGEEIPLRWLKFEEALAADKTNNMSLDETRKLTQPFGIESDRELLTMLTFYHDLGYVVYFGGIDDRQSLLQDIVILNPQWLIDVFKQVITILHPAKRDGIVSDAWTTLEKDGILEDKLIQHMWQGFLKQKGALVKLMTRFDLICEAPVERLKQEQQDGVDTEVNLQLNGAPTRAPAAMPQVLNY